MKKVKIKNQETDILLI